MKLIKFETDYFFWSNTKTADLKALFSEVPKDCKIYFVTLSGTDLLFKNSEGEIMDTSMSDWEEFWDKAWIDLAGSIEKGRKKIKSDIPDSYFDLVICNEAKTKNK